MPASTDPSSPKAPPPPSATRWLRPRRVFAFGILFLLSLPVALWLAGRRAGQPLWLELAPSQVAVRRSAFGGATERITQPGFHLVLPWLQSVTVLDKQDRELLMNGDLTHGLDRSDRLTVRSVDGSEFWFADAGVRYRVRPESSELLSEAGDQAGERAAEWVRALARPVLRDEFGRLEPNESASANRLEEAKARGRERLAELLDPLGLELLGVSTPKPQFDRTYEKAIEARKVLEQEAERLGGDLEAAFASREAKLAAAERQEQLRDEELAAELERALLEAEAKEIQARAKADQYAVARAGERAELERSLAEELERARESERVSTEQLVFELARLEDFEAPAVRREWIDFLARTPVQLLPTQRNESREVKP